MEEWVGANRHVLHKFDPHKSTQHVTIQQRHASVHQSLIMETLLRGQAAPQAEIISLGEAKNQIPGQKLTKC